MAAIHHTSFIVSSINGSLHVTWTNSDSSTSTEIIDPRQTFPDEISCQTFLNNFAKSYNAGKDQEWLLAHPVVDTTILSMIGQTFSVS